MDEGLKEVLNGGFGPGCLASTPPTVNLMRLYKEIVRSEVCKHTIESIYKLCDHHLSTHNYAEAGFTLKMHADRLNWTWDPVPGDAFGSLGQLENRNHQFEWQLKENLYITMLDYFDRAKCWEEGIPLMKEMAEFYERKIFDYFKWSQLLVSIIFVDSFMVIPFTLFSFLSLFPFTLFSFLSLSFDLFPVSFHSFSSLSRLFQWVQFLYHSSLDRKINLYSWTTF